MNCFVIFGNDCKDQCLALAGGICEYQLRLSVSGRFASDNKSLNSG